jgi:hypothetical protein
LAALLVEEVEQVEEVRFLDVVVPLLVVELNLNCL